MNLLLTLAQAKEHLRITDSDHDTEVQSKTDSAAAIISDYVSSGRTRWDTPLPATDSDGWIIMQTAALELLASMYEHRGDDYGVNAPDEEVWNAIRRKLSRLRDPAFA